MLDTLKKMHDALKAMDNDVPAWLALVVTENPEGAVATVELDAPYKFLPLTPLQAQKLKDEGKKGENCLSPSQKKFLGGLTEALKAGKDLSDLAIAEYKIRAIARQAQKLRAWLKRE